MLNRRFAPLALVAVPLVAAACGSSGSSPKASTAPATTTPAAAAPATTAPSAGAAAGLIAMSSPDGQVLGTSNGYAVYTLLGSNGSPLPCTGHCLQIWPAVNGPSGSPAQVGSYPVYTFTHDTAPGQVHGEDIHTFGGTWYLLSPAGMPITSPSSGATSATSTSGGAAGY